jgi:hypothetical protein
VTLRPPHQRRPSAEGIGAGEQTDAAHPFVLPVTDLGGRPRVTDNSVDIGAYEYGGGATHSGK